MKKNVRLSKKSEKPGKNIPRPALGKITGPSNAVIDHFC